MEGDSPQQLEMTDGEDNDFFGSADKDLMDENLKVEEVKEYYGDEADDDASEQDQNEDGLDIDQNSAGGGDQKEETKSES